VGTAKKVGYGIGLVFALAMATIFGMTFMDTVIPSDARLAELRATYFDDTDRLAVAIILTNSDGEFTEANGHLELTIKNNGRTVYSNEYGFKKDDFLTWNNLFGGQTRGVVFTINERFPGKSFSGEEYDVYADLKLKPGRSWEGLHASFYSFE